MVWYLKYILVLRSFRLVMGSILVLFLNQPNSSFSRFYYLTRTS